MAHKRHLRTSKEYPANPETIGQHLLKVRIDRKLSRMAVAVEIGVNPTTIAMWERKKAMPEVMQMKGIIAFLGYDPLPEPMTLAERIRKYRNVNGLTLEEFGKLLSVDGATVWTWENERYVPLAETKGKIQDLINQKSL
jgi:DNA-binding XRE family transcriptional regulator